MEHNLDVGEALKIYLKKTDNIHFFWRGWGVHAATWGKKASKATLSRWIRFCTSETFKDEGI